MVLVEEKSSARIFMLNRPKQLNACTVVAAYNPLGWNRIDYIRIPVRLHVFAFENDAGKRRRFVSMADLPQNETIEIGPRNLKLSLSSSYGQLKRISNSKTGRSTNSSSLFLPQSSGL